MPRQGTAPHSESPAGPGPASTLDDAAIEAVRRQANTKIVRPAPGSAEALWRDGVIQRLNGELATELVCVLRSKRHHHTAHGLASPAIAEEFAVQAAEEMAHADRLARRIVQLGGEPDFTPDTLTERSHAAYDDSLALKAMIHANLTAERVAIESCGPRHRPCAETRHAAAGCAGVAFGRPCQSPFSVR